MLALLPSGIETIGDLESEDHWDLFTLQHVVPRCGLLGLTDPVDALFSTKHRTLLLQHLDHDSRPKVVQCPFAVFGTIAKEVLLGGVAVKVQEKLNLLPLRLQLPNQLY